MGDSHIEQTATIHSLSLKPAMATIISLLPMEIFQTIIDHVVGRSRLERTTPLRLVSRTFNQAVIYSIFSQLDQEAQNPGTLPACHLERLDAAPELVTQYLWSRVQVSTDSNSLNLSILIAASIRSYELLCDNVGSSHLSPSFTDEYRHILLESVASRLRIQDIFVLLKQKTPALEAVENVEDGILVLAAARNDTKTLSLLLSSITSEKTAPSRYFGSALMAATNRNRVEAVRLLLDHFAEFTQARKDIPYPVKAYSRGRKKDFFLQRHANAHLTSKINRRMPDMHYQYIRYGMRSLTPFALACSKGHNEIIQLYLEKKYGLKRDGTRYLEAIHCALVEKNVSLVDFLIQKSTCNSTVLRRALLFMASSCGNAKIVNKMLDEGAVLDGRRYAYHHPRWDAIPPIAHAAAAGHTHIIELLLDRGARTYSTREIDAFELAVQNGHVESAHLLYTWDPRYSWEKSRRCNRILTLAADSGDENMVRKLLGWGIDPLDRDDGFRALKIACMDGQVGIAIALLEAGMDIDTNKSLPLRIAASFGQTRLVKALLLRGARKVDPNLLFPEPEDIGRKNSVFPLYRFLNLVSPTSLPPGPEMLQILRP